VLVVVYGLTLQTLTLGDFTFVFAPMLEKREGLNTSIILFSSFILYFVTRSLHGELYSL